MNEQQRESTGKTVDEAIREALLRMGLRREEVEVTVLQKARSGILGFGRRDAVVRVVKKSSKARQARGRRQEQATNRSGAAPETLSGRRVSGKSGGKPSGKPNSKPGGKPGRHGRPQAESLSGEPSKTHDHDRHIEQPDTEGRRRRPRRRRKKSSEGQERDTATARNAVQASEADHVSGHTPVDNHRSAGSTEVAPVETVREEPLIEPVVDRPEETGRVADDSAIALGIRASTRCEPWTGADINPQAGFLTRVATELMVKSGFACRVQVQEGEYNQIKMVVDDRSAGILIGRYGNTVDAIEHIVEKIASKAAGDRVRMNLDINNYRLRCEDHLVQLARAAAAEVRESGRPVEMAPAGGRERRIVHLYIQESGDLATYTEAGPEGKFVVICRQDQVPEEHRRRNEQAAGEHDDEPAGAPEAVGSLITDGEAGIVGQQDMAAQRKEDD